MNGITIGEGTTDEWIHAVNEMYKQQQYFTSLADFDVYGKACEGGYRFLVAKTDQNEFVGCVSLAACSGEYAVLDNYFVMPQFRGGGLGRALFEAVCNNAARQKYNLALHSETSLSDFYAKHGFTIKLDYKIQVFNLSNFKKISIEDNHHLSILEKPTEVERNDFYDYDEKVWRHPRKAFLSVWLQRADARVLAAQTGNGVTVGYGVLREACSPNTYILGPLYADNEAALVSIMQAFLDELKPTDVIQTRIPSMNVQKFKQALACRAALDFQSEYIPQYTKSAPDLDPQYVYSITDFSAPL